jgi:hypothetical protein
MSRLIAVFAVGGLVLASCTADDPSRDDAATPAVTEPVATEPAGTEPVVAEPEVTEPERPAAGDVGTMDGWVAVLAGVTARTTPPSAACPDALDVDALATPPSFPDPLVSPFDALATFDTLTNSVVVVRHGANTFTDPWTGSVVAGRLDVCTGEWSPMNADFGTHDDDGGPVLPSGLVYDVDSDALVGFAWNGVHVYDRDADEWIRRPDLSNRSATSAVYDRDADEWSFNPNPTAYGVISAAYHPASGRILVVSGMSLWSYDVDEAEWARILLQDSDTFFGEILGINVALDKIVIAEGEGGHGSQVFDVTRLVDPVTGEYTDVPTPGRPIADIYNGWGPDEAFGQVAGTVFVSDSENGTLCGFDAETLGWDLCVDSPLVEPEPNTPSGWAGVWAIVGDPINDQLIAVPPSGPIRTTPLP